MCTVPIRLPQFVFLYTVSTANGAVTAVGSGLGVNIVQESGLASDGTNIWAVDDSGDIFKINPLSGVGVHSATSLDFEGLAIQTQTAPVPEPSSLAIFGLGALGLVGARRRKKKTV